MFKVVLNVRVRRIVTKQMQIHYLQRHLRNMTFELYQLCQSIQISCCAIFSALASSNGLYSKTLMIVTCSNTSDRSKIQIWMKPLVSSFADRRRPEKRKIRTSKSVVFRTFADKNYHSRVVALSSFINRIEIAWASTLPVSS